MKIIKGRHGAPDRLVSELALLWLQGRISKSDLSVHYDLREQELYAFVKGNERPSPGK